MKVLGLILAVGLGLSGAAALADGVTVTSGEHGDFTRIALDFGHPVDWQVGRTPDGYALRVTGEEPSYDLTQVFDLIGKDRISALWVDKANGDLHLGIGCACYAMPFAFRPSIVVIDVKSGKPPKGSAFEADLPGAAAAQPPVFDAQAGQPPTDGRYDWVGARAVSSPAAAAAEPVAPATPLPVDTALEPLRKALLEEMSRGAAAGLIDMSLPRETTDGMVVGIPSAQIALGDSPNYAAHIGETSDKKVNAAGEACLPDEAVDIGSWALSDQPVSMQMALPMTDLIGEFDKPDPEALAKAVKFQLFLGFGAEARAYLRAFPVEEKESAIWTSMGAILDGDPDPAQAFVTMANCDTQAALWAALSIPNLALEPAVNSKSIVRAFSALPPHLRLLLGPRLADQMLSIHDDLAARSIRDAVTRLPGEKAADVTLLEAKLDVAQGDLDAAEARLAPLAGQSGPASEDALADLVTTTAHNLKPISPDQVDALAAVAQERRDSADAARFDSAVVLGRAAAGQFDEAFAGLKEHPDLADTVWQILAVLGSDEDVLRHAVLAPGTPPPEPAAKAAERLADRLLGLGFVPEAGAWLALAPDPAPDLLARYNLARRDGTAAVAAVAGVDDPAAADLKAQGLTLTGNHRAAADVWKGLGQDQAFWAAEGLAQDWPVIADGGPAPWSDAAKAYLTDPTPPAPAKDAPPNGPLAQARAIVSTTETTRAAIDALLTAVPSPAPPSQ